MGRVADEIERALWRRSHGVRVLDASEIAQLQKEKEDAQKKVDVDRDRAKRERLSLLRERFAKNGPHARGPDHSR